MLSTPEPSPVSADQSASRVSGRRRVAIGCFTCWLGLVSGAMIAVLISKIVAFISHARSCDGIPSCNWYIYAMIGGGVGAISLPLLVLWVLGKPAKRMHPDRGT